VSTHCSLHAVTGARSCQAATENHDLKFKIFADVDRLSTGRRAETNTSSISITEIAARTSRPSR
jgi:3-hydroxybutyryl-CoA dehydrogenase